MKMHRKYYLVWKKNRFSIEEIEMWNQIIEKMYFPYDEKRQIYPMDDGL